MTEQTLTQMDAAIASPWRDGSAESEKSADLFDEVVAHLLHNAPESTQFVLDNGPTNFVDSVVDIYVLQPRHLDYLLMALSDNGVRELADKLAAQVRLVAESSRQPVTV